MIGSHKIFLQQFLVYEYKLPHDSGNDNTNPLMGNIYRSLKMWIWKEVLCINNKIMRQILNALLTYYEFNSWATGLVDWFVDSLQVVDDNLP